MAEEHKKSAFNKELVPKLKSLAEKLIDQSRSHLLQICLISGAISAFLMPLYVSKQFSPMQHLFIALSLTCFLLSILIGMLYLSYKLTREKQNIFVMIDIIEEENEERLVQFQKEHDRLLSWRTSIDIKACFSDVLFAAGVVFLILVIFVS